MTSTWTLVSCSSTDSTMGDSHPSYYCQRLCQVRSLVAPLPNSHPSKHFDTFCRHPAVSSPPLHCLSFSQVTHVRNLCVPFVSKPTATSVLSTFFALPFSTYNILATPSPPLPATSIWRILSCSPDSPMVPLHLSSIIHCLTQPCSLQNPLTSLNTPMVIFSN